MAFYENTIVAKQDLAEKELKIIKEKYNEIINKSLTYCDGYGAVFALILGLFFTQIATVEPAGLTVLRDRNQLFRINQAGEVENTYTLKIINKTQQTQEYQLSVRGLKNVSWYGKQSVSVDPGEVFSLPMSLGINADELDSPIAKIEFQLSAGEHFTLRAESRFIKKL